MKKIAIFTGTRADYGLLYWLMVEIKKNTHSKLQVIVSGNHLSDEYGKTITEIEQDGFVIDEKVEMLLSSNTAVGVAKSVGLGLISYADAISRLSPDLIIVLGDRYEALAMAQAALFLRVPLAHLHGGEVTENAYDDSIRHSITKMSNFHFCSSENSRRRLLQLGEDPANVFNVGAIGLDHLQKSSFYSRQDIYRFLQFPLEKKYFVVVFHPETLSQLKPAEAFEKLLKVLDSYSKYNLVITYPNADDGSKDIIHKIEDYSTSNPKRVRAFKSIGHQKFFSVLKYSELIIGNSSSGIIEAPSLKIPTVNVGKRQHGREAARSVFNTSYDASEITIAIESAINFAHVDVENPYGSGQVAEKILEIALQLKLSVKKSFFDYRCEKNG